MNERIITALQEPLRLMQDPNARTWWPAIVGSLIIALAYEMITARGGRLNAFKRGLLLGPLLHPSSQIDLQLLFVRGVVRVLIIGSLPWTIKYLSIKTISFLYAYVGERPSFSFGPDLILIYSVSFLVISDLSRYVLHRLMHGVPLLWRFHQIHHSAEVLTPFSLYRIHPVEQVLQSLRRLVIVGVTAGFFAWISGGQASVWTLYGVPGVVLIFGVLGANIRHSHTWIPYPSWMERILISPAQHQQHHGISEAGQRSNYGSMLAVWDWLLGSLRLSSAGRPDAFGLSVEDRFHNPRRLGSVLFDPFRLWRKN
jgi:sterol desaturase/sphingolipid hydroxylase (fatty acid hydroxylase superfamily)